MRIYSYDVLRNVPELKLISHAKIIYARKTDGPSDLFDDFIKEAIKQEFSIVACREYTEADDLKREVERYQKGIFHIQYEPDTDTIELYITELYKKAVESDESLEWPVFDIPLPLFAEKRADGMSVIFEEHISFMKYEWNDTESAKAFIEEYKHDLLNPML